MNRENEILERKLPFSYPKLVNGRPEHFAVILSAMREYAREMSIEKDKEIERLKGLIRVTHQTAYSNGYTCGQVDNSYYEENCWQTFATENNL
jgi:hypothetical protein